MSLSNVQMQNAQNGARIKAFAGPGVGSGIVNNVTFSFFAEGNVDNPFIINQVCTYLCTIGDKTKRSAVLRNQCDSVCCIPLQRLY